MKHISEVLPKVYDELKAKNNNLQNIYTMLREFYYEKNGIDDTIKFLEYIIKELKKIRSDK